MKKTQKIALCGVFSALSVVIMLTAYFPYATYAIAALAGCSFAVITIEAGRKWALGSYIASAIITLLICEKEAAMLFVGFFGYYCILKGLIEEHFRGAIEWLLKFLSFNIAVIISYLVIVFVFDIPMDESGKLGDWFLGVLLALGNIVFWLYDIGLSRVIGMYIYKWHPKIAKIFK